ncbi:hypothetical protein ACJX0J_018169, partial [Zea mays]
MNGGMEGGHIQLLKITHITHVVLCIYYNKKYVLEKITEISIFLCNEDSLARDSGKEYLLILTLIQFLICF